MNCEDGNLVYNGGCWQFASGTIPNLGVYPNSSSDMNELGEISFGVNIIKQVKHNGGKQK